MRILPFGVVFAWAYATAVITATAYSLQEPRSSLVADFLGHSSDCKCENGKCVADFRGNKKCICKPRYVIQTEGVCKECYCGTKGKCYFESANSIFRKKCLCDKGFAEKEGVCVDCQCGENSKCEFEGFQGVFNKICYCLEGYADLEGACKECNCGEFGECEFRDGKKHCTCFENFLEHKGKCEECDCGHGDCSFQGDKKKCKCNPGYSLKGDRCEACDCGPESILCSFDLQGRGRKECTCKAGFAQKIGTCAACNCGPRSTNCAYDSASKKVCTCETGYAQKYERCESCSCGAETRTCGFAGDQKVCTCAEGFTPVNGICKAKCQGNVDCKNGGVCVGEEDRKVCRCRKGTSGDKCEIIDDCKKIGPTCYSSGGFCKYDVARERAFCDCPPGKPWNPAYIRCEDCNCGANSLSCLFDFKGNKICTCQKGFAQRGDTCTLCNCGQNSVDCAFGADGNEICRCKEGYAQKDRTCRATCSTDDDCKHKSKCISDGINKAKFCKCKNGLEGDNCDIVVGCKGFDVVCKKGGGNCKYDPEKEKALCECPGNQIFNPKTNRCEVCSCGGNTVSCTFGADGNEICRCKAGFAQKGRICTATCTKDDDCKHESKCIGDGINREKFCKCKKGLEGDNCDIVVGCKGFDVVCRNGGGTCKYDPDNEKAYCQCPGNKIYNPLTKRCQDTCRNDDECRNGGTCVKMGDGNFCRCGRNLGGDKCEKIIGCEYLQGCLQSRGQCRYNVTSESVFCHCPEGFRLHPQTKKCEKERCIEKACIDGKCQVVGGQEVCSCPEDFVLEGDFCRKLKCKYRACYGGKCVVKANNIEDCDCPFGFWLEGDTCMRGPCRPSTCFGGRCEKVNGSVVCICPKGYRLEGIGCFAIVCKRTNCFGGVCRVIGDGDEEVCTCYDGYVLKGGVCHQIRCLQNPCFGGKCEVVGGKEVCTCPPGYTLQGQVCQRSHLL